MRRKTLSAISAILALALLAGGCSAGQETDSTVKISTQAVKQGSLQIGVYADGRITIPLTKVNFATAGTIGEILVEPGQTVLAGDLLARLDTTDMQAAIDNAETSLRKAQIAYDDAIATRDYTLKSEKIKLDSLYAKYVARFDDTIYQQAIADATDKVADKEVALALAQADLDALLAEQEALDTSDSVPGTESEVSPTPATTPTLTPAAPTPTPSPKDADDLDAAISAARKEVDAATAALDTAQTGLNNALVSLANAKARYDSDKAAAKEAYNLQKLKYENLSASTTSIVNAELNLAEAQRKLDEARTALDHVNLTAPAAGKIIDIAFSAGDIVLARTSSTAGTSDFITLYDPANVQLVANVNESDISGLAVGQEMRVGVDALFLENQPGTVLAVDILPKIDNTGIVTYAVTGQLTKPDERILDGMSVFVLFLKKEKTGILLVSNKAVFMNDGRQHVHVQLADGTIEKRAVTLGLTNGTVSEVIDGLQAGEMVVTSGVKR